MMDIRKDILLRVYIVYLAILIFGIIIIAKAVSILVLEKEELESKAKKQEIRIFEIEAIRGNICSDDGTPIATSFPIFDIRMDVCSELISDEMFKENIDSLAICLASLFKDRKPSDYKTVLWEARRNGERYLLIKRDITYPELRKVRQFPIFSLGKYKGGLIVIPQYRRELPYKNLARRTIGYESTESPNKIYVGLEGSFTKNLQGSNGKRLERRIGGGAWIPVEVENQVEPLNGQDVITTIDINLQDLAESALRKELILDSADHGCVIVMEVNTGHIKAIANLGKSPEGGYKETYNYAIGESTEPGSTFKLASFLVALEDGKITPETPVNLGNGVAKYSGRTMTDAHKLTGTLLAHQVFEKSSNVGTSRIITNAYSDSPQKYIDGLYRLSIHKLQDLQVGGEGRPYIKSTSSKWWSAVSLPWMSIGYEVALTPLQTLTLYNAVANNGKMMKPLFVKEIRRNGEVVESFNPVVINPAICSPSTISQARLLMEGVVERGTGSFLKNPYYKIAGKTGTAQVAQNNKGYAAGTKNVKYKGTFVGYFPSDNPKYSCIVVINNPSRGRYYGGAVAGPVFKEIADRIYARMDNLAYSPPKDTTVGAGIPFANAGLQKDLIEVFSFLNITARTQVSNAIWSEPVREPGQISLIPDMIVKGQMPDVSGMGLKDAVFLLEENDLKVSVNGKGNVIRQSVPAGSLCIPGTVVVLDLAVK